LLHESFGVSKDYHATRTEVEEGGVVVSSAPSDKLCVCPKWRSQDVIRKGKRVRRVQTLPNGFHPVHVKVEVAWLEFKECGLVFELAPPFLPGLRALHSNAEPVVLRAQPRETRLSGQRLVINLLGVRWVRVHTFLTI